MRVKHWSSGERKDMTLSSILEYEVSSTNSERGVAEDAHAKIEKLTQIIGIMADGLSFSAQERVLDEACFYWRPD